MEVERVRDGCMDGMDTENTFENQLSFSFYIIDSFIHFFNLKSLKFIILIQTQLSFIV